MEFEWDENKNQSNIRKHGISFSEARSVFEDSNSILFEDERFNYGERRYIAIGGFYSEFLNRNIIVTVVYTERGEDLIRIISARKANKTEKRLYEQQD